MNNTSSDREIIHTRVFNVPPSVMFKAWIDPRQLTQWFGPAGFRSTFHEFDPVPGGYWRFTLHGPDGKDYPNEIVFVEIVEPARIVFNHLSLPNVFQITATFDDEGGKTRLTWRMLFESKERFDVMKPIVSVANEQNLDRLEAHLSKRASAP